MNCIHPNAPARGDVEVAPVVGLDLVDRGQHLPPHPILDPSRLIDRQQENRDPELANHEIRHPRPKRRTRQRIHKPRIRPRRRTITITQTRGLVGATFLARGLGAAGWARSAWACGRVACRRSRFCSSSHSSSGAASSGAGARARVQVRARGPARRQPARPERVRARSGRLCRGCGWSRRSGGRGLGAGRGRIGGQSLGPGQGHAGDPAGHGGQRLVGRGVHRHGPQAAVGQLNDHASQACVGGHGLDRLGREDRRGGHHRQSRERAAWTSGSLGYRPLPLGLTPGAQVPTLGVEGPAIEHQSKAQLEG